MIWNSNKFGFDVSYFQDNNVTIAPINFKKMKDYGAAFVIIRSSYGRTRDEDALTNLANARGLLPRGIYHYWWNMISPTEQAMTVINTIQGQGIEGRVWLDLETTASGVYGSSTHWRQFMQIIEAAGYRTGVYTGFPWWKDHAVSTGSDLSFFYARPLWQAWYTSNPFNVVVAGSWGRVMIWQSGTPSIGAAAGVESLTIDYNQWNASYDFGVEWGTTPPMENNMANYELISANYDMSLRTDHLITAARIETILRGVKMRADALWTATSDGTNVKAGDQWAHVTSAGGVNKSGWVAVKHLGVVYCVMTEIAPPPPATTLPDLPVSITLGDDVIYAKQVVNVTLKPK
jgi:GH25 family lysozyme M1 (1,4-beta-N-acetylmuramidase)